LLIGSNAKQSFDKGLALFNQGKFEDALPHFQKATELEPEYAEAYLYLGRSYLNLSKWIEAIHPLRTAYTLSPVETKKEVVNILLDALIGGALAEFKKGNFKESISYLNEALDLDPESTEARNELINSLIGYGSELLSEGDASEAVSQFSEAIKIAPDNLQAYLGLAKSLFRSGKFLDAMNTVKDALEMAPTAEDRSAFQDLLEYR
jgi:tetratricopeptide (TPR) repeat protein